MTARISVPKPAVTSLHNRNKDADRLLAGPHFFEPNSRKAMQPLLRAATAENRQPARNPIRQITPFVDTIAPLVYFNWNYTREWVALRQNRTK